MLINILRPWRPLTRLSKDRRKTVDGGLPLGFGFPAAQRLPSFGTICMPVPVRKAVFPVAGLGTRFLPATKAMPKEMLTIVDRPLIQYVVDEAREAGIEDFRLHYRAQQDDHRGSFRHSAGIGGQPPRTRPAGRPRRAGERPPRARRFLFTRQQIPLGLGHAVWCAREIYRQGAIRALLPDMLMLGRRSCLTEMVDVYKQTAATSSRSRNAIPR